MKKGPVISVEPRLGRASKSSIKNTPTFIKLRWMKKGPVAEWLGRALQKLVQRFESARDLKKTLKPVF